MTTNLSKAAQKRLDDTKSSFTYLLNNKLVDFKNKYLQDYSDWTIYNLEQRLESLKNSTPQSTKYMNLETAIKSKETGVRMLEAKLSRKALIHFTEEVELKAYYEKYSYLLEN